MAKDESAVFRFHRIREFGNCVGRGYCTQPGDAGLYCRSGKIAMTSEGKNDLPIRDVSDTDLWTVKFRCACFLLSIGTQQHTVLMEKPRRNGHLALPGPLRIEPICRTRSAWPQWMLMERKVPNRIWGQANGMHCGPERRTV